LDAEGGGQFTLEFPAEVSLPDFGNLLGREFDGVMADALGEIVASLPAFRERVPIVVFGGSDEEMIRPNARRIIAMVADAHSGRDGSVVKLPRNAVGTEPFAVPHEPSIIFVGVSVPIPEPAPISFSDLPPEEEGVALRSHGSPSHRWTITRRANWDFT
jgi:hypothetical protein